jgi:3-dehydroquinate synthase
VTIRVPVELAGRSYQIWVGDGLIKHVSDYIPAGHEKVVIIADRKVDGLYGDDVVASFSPETEVHRLTVPSGERSKAWATAGQLLEEMAALKIRRHDLVVSLGGGVATDLGGYVASVYQRGIKLAHVPTTLLGQVDAAIGGKTGVNLRSAKNMAGTFYQPSAVVADTEVLATLSARQFRSGMAEVVKYGLTFDSEILEMIGQRPGKGPAGKDLNDLVAQCAAIKADVVSQDELDTGRRILLNYGHTLGHALEAAGGYRKFLHGEAISVGMAFAAKVAELMGLLSADDVALHQEILGAVGLPVKASFDEAAVTEAWDRDKKHRQAKRWVLLYGLQNPVVRSDVPEDVLEGALAWVRQ